MSIHGYNYSMGSDFDYLQFGPEDATKLVILLHGYGRNAVYMQKMADAVLAIMPNVKVICPHAPQSLDMQEVNKEGDHFLHVPQELRQGDIVYDRNDMRQWFAIDGTLNNLLPRMAVSASAMNNFIDAQQKALNLGDSDTVLMGFSQGAGLALYTAQTRKHELAGLVIHSSILLEKSSGDPAIRCYPPALFIYGSEDPEFPQAVYEDSARRLKQCFDDRISVQVVAGLGHVTNAKSRAICAAFIRSCLV